MSPAKSAAAPLPLVANSPLIPNTMVSFNTAAVGMSGIRSSSLSGAPAHPLVRLPVMARAHCVVCLQQSSLAVRALPDRHHHSQVAWLQWAVSCCATAGMVVRECHVVAPGWPDSRPQELRHVLHVHRAHSAVVVPPVLAGVAAAHLQGQPGGVAGSLDTTPPRPKNRHVLRTVVI